MGCCPTECEILLPSQDPGFKFYCVLTAVEDGSPYNFTGQTVGLVLDPQDDDLPRLNISGVVGGGGLNVAFEQDQTWSAANLIPGTFYEVRLTVGTTPDIMRVGPVMGLRITSPAKGVL